MRKSGGEAWPDMWEQWEHSQHSNHPLIEPPHVEAAMKQTVQAAEAQGPNLSSMTSHVISTLKRSRDQMESETRDWFDRLPPHVARAYTYEDQIVQIPLFVRLLRGCGYPDCNALEADLCSGFPLLGELAHSPGWRPRADDKYAHPISGAAFAVAELNVQHIKERLRRPRPDAEWSAMLAEVLEEKQAGRIEGPFEAHPSWGFESLRYMLCFLCHRAQLMLLLLSASFKNPRRECRQAKSQTVRGLPSIFA